MLAVGLFLSLRASDALRTAGWSFLYVQDWAPEKLDFGVAAILFGTVTIALIALTVSFPLSLGTALLLSEAVDGKLRGFLVSLVDLMAAVPSIVFGLWGVYFLQGAIIPVSRWISIWFGWLPIFAVTDAAGLPFSEASAFTSSAFIAGIVVGFMVVPTQTSIMREAFTRAPMGEREGAYALGATRWGMIRAVVLPFGKGGIIGGTMLGLGRALGETIAVYMIISPDLHHQLAGAEDRHQLGVGADRAALRRGQRVRPLRPDGRRARAVPAHARDQLHRLVDRRPVEVRSRER